jgi:hypothetical protein
MRCNFFLSFVLFAVQKAFRVFKTILPCFERHSAYAGFRKEFLQGLGTSSFSAD